MNATDLGPIVLLEPITGITWRAGSFSLYSQGDEPITLAFHKIIVLPEELVKATQTLVGKGLIIYKNRITDNDDPVTMIQVTSDMKLTGEVYDATGKMRHYYVYDYLRGSVVRSPLQMSELIETENTKLLEEQ